MDKRFLIASILIVACLAAAGTAYYLYRPNSARMLAFRAWMTQPRFASGLEAVGRDPVRLGPVSFPHRWVCRFSVG